MQRCRSRQSRGGLAGRPTCRSRAAQAHRCDDFAAVRRRGARDHAQGLTDACGRGKPATDLHRPRMGGPARIRRMSMMTIGRADLAPPIWNSNRVWPSAPFFLRSACMVLIEGSRRQFQPSDRNRSNQAALMRHTRLMPKPATGADNEPAIAAARELLRTAKTADELRTAQAVLLPLERAFSLAETAATIGRSVSWVNHERRRFLSAGGMPVKGQWGGRRRQWVDPEDEVAIVKQAILNTVGWGDVALMKDIARQLQERTPGAVIPRSTAHTILMRVAKKIIPGLQHKHDFRQLTRALAEHWQREGAMQTIAWGWDQQEAPVFKR